jgi:hypothetical protein
VAAGVLFAAAYAFTVVGLPLAAYSFFVFLGGFLGGMECLASLGPQCLVMLPVLLLVVLLPFAPLLAAPFYWRAAVESRRASSAAIGMKRSGRLAEGAFLATFGLAFGAYLAAGMLENQAVIGTADPALAQRLAAAPLYAPSHDDRQDAAMAGYEGSGWGFMLSPDGRTLLFRRSAGMGHRAPDRAGELHVYLWDEASRRATRILSLRDVHAGLGTGYIVTWSGDGSSLHLTGSGTIDGYSNRDLNLYYVLDQGRWVQVPTATPPAP